MMKARGGFGTAGNRTESLSDQEGRREAGGALPGTTQKSQCPQHMVWCCCWALAERLP